MERRDYLMRYFEQLGYVLARLLGLKEDRKYHEAFQLIDEAMKDMLDTTADEWLLVPENKFIDVTSEKLTFDQQKVLSELLYENAELLYVKDEKNKSTEFYKRSRLLFEYINITEKTFSIERMNKINRIAEVLRQ